jgi:asparagine synthase (glutamine-hydrolysing)
MCGYFFHKSKDLKKNNLLKSLIKKDLNRRGPDSFKIVENKDFKIYFARLKIIDPSYKSDQPFTDDNKRYYLIFNGEIYNYIKLKEKLLNSGVKFKTKSDTEVLFHLLKIKGIKYTLKIIEGMFSFIFYDSKKKQIFGARDHFGQKPFYYYKNSDNFIASTNIKPILRNLTVRDKSLDYDICKFYLCSSGIIPKNKTFFKNIKNLPAGYYLTVKKNTIRKVKYFSPINFFNKNIYNGNKQKSLQDVKYQLKDKINKAIKKHLICDTKVGSTLSGGIDSSLIANYLNKLDNNTIFLTNRSPEIENLSKLVPKIIKKLKIRKNRIIYIKQKKSEYFKNLINLNHYSLSPAKWGGGPPMKELCKVARINKIKVLLGGDGVDEYFCGYDTFKDSINNEKKHNLHKILNLNNRFKINNILKKKYYNEIENSKKEIENKIKFIKDRKEKKILVNTFLDMEYFLQSCPLPYVDEYSMHESVEMRSPYLDLELVKFCANIPTEYKFSETKNISNKYLLRKLASEELGNYINRPKEGTRNYSKSISNPIFWNLDNFLIIKKLSIRKDLTYKELFKVINLEIIYRYLSSKNNLLVTNDLFTDKGRNNYIFKNVIA